MNLYGIVTGTNGYTLNVALPAGFKLQVGDTVTIRPQNANTGAATLDIGLGAMPLTLNGAALSAGQLEAGKDRQCTFAGSGFALDNAGGSGASFVGTSSNLTLGDGSAGIVPAGCFGNLSSTDIAAALDAGSGTASQVVRGDGTISALLGSDLPMPSILQLTRITSVTSGLSGSYADNNLVFNETTVNDASGWTVSSGVATCVTAGRYLVILSSALDQSQGIIYWIVKNSTKIAEDYSTQYTSSNTATIASFLVGDTLKVVVAGPAGPAIQPGAKLFAIYLGKAS